ncbi:MAG: hypothetical protein K2H20_00490, partial [Bacilli bacterium]|nr:hypothetical protein [Bacilli bacterium]
MNEQSNINPNSQQNGGGLSPVQPVTPQNQVQPVQQPAPVSPAPAPVQTTQPVQAVPASTPAPQQAPVQAPPVQQVPVQNEAIQPTVEQPKVEVAATLQTSVPSETVSTVPTPQVSQPVAENVQQVEIAQQPQVIPQPTQSVQTTIPSDIQQNQAIQPEVVQVPVQPVAPIQPIASEQNINNAPNNGVFGPSVPLNGVNATDIGFVAASTEMPKKKKKGPVIAIIIIILIALAALGYFVIYPFIMKTYFSNPKNVYEASIKTVIKNLSSTTNDLVHNKAIYDIEASFDSNIESLKDYTGYSYNVNFGIDPVKKTIQEGISIKNLSSNAEHSYYYYIKDSKAYERYSSYRGYIYKGEVDPEQTKDIFSLFSNDELFDNANKLSSEDINYLIEKISQLLVDSIDESKLSKSDSSITIDGKTIKVTDNKYEIDYKTMVNTVNFVIDGIIKDEKSLELISKMYDVSEEDLKKALEDSKMTDNNDDEIIDRSETITTSIYT